MAVIVTDLARRRPTSPAPPNLQNLQRAPAGPLRVPAEATKAAENQNLLLPHVRQQQLATDSLAGHAFYDDQEQRQQLGQWQ